MGEKEDLILIKLDKIDDTLNTFQKAVTTVEVVLMGANKNNGLCGTVKEHGKQLEKLKNWKWKVSGGIVAGSSIIGWICKNMDKWWKDG
jgi:hypothetical protein